MARRTRSFLFDNISKRLVQNTNKTAKEINTRKTANTTANTDILTKAEVETVISNTSIATLSDTTVANVANEQVLQYNANTGKWENETLSLVSSVDGLTDTNLTSLSNGDYLVYSSSGSEWINRSLDLSSYVTDTEIADYSNTAQMNTAIAASNTLMTTYVDDQVANVSVDLSSYSTTTQMNTAIAASNTAMKSYVDAEVAGVVNSAPTTLDTLNELAAALGDDPDFATTVSTNIGTKLAKSSNLSDLTNAATARTNLGLGTAATTASTDYATSAQGTKADTAHGWGNHASAGYGTSNFSGAYADLTGKPSLFSGSYNDLSNKPTIPTNNNQLTNGAGYITSAFISDKGNAASLDLDNLTASSDEGFYSWGSTQPTNSPGWTYGGVLVLRDQNQNHEIAFGGSGNGAQRLAIRRADSGTYNSWTEFWSTADFSSTKISNWDTAYGWGNHASAGYITSTVSSDLDIVGDVKAAGQIRATGWWNTNSSDRSGYAVEIGWSGGEGYLLSYSRTASAYGAMNYSATSHDFSNGNVRLKSGKVLEFESSSGNARGYIQATETNDQHMIIATTGGEDIAFKDGGITGDSNVIIRGDGNVWIRGSILNGSIAYSQLTGTPTIPTNNNQLTNGAGYTTYTSNQATNTSSNVTFNNIYASEWLRNNHAGEGLYNQATSQHFYSAGSSYWHINSGNGLIFYSAYNSAQGNATNRKGYVYFDSSGFGLLHSGGGWAVRTVSGTTELYGNVTLNSISQAPSEWNPVLLEDGGIIKKDNSVSIHGSGYLRASYLNMSHGVGNRTNDTVFYSSYDDYIRKNDKAGMQGSLGIGAGCVYLDVSGANYGTVKVDDDRGVTWAGYTIRDDWSLMADGASNFGIYNDTDNEWAVLCRRNADTELMYNGNAKLETDGSGITVNGRIDCTSQTAYIARNYGHGIFGVYSATRYQHVWSMGTAYKTNASGTSYGNMYGLTYTHTNIGTGTNQAISGLSHQLQHRTNGTLTAAIGSGIWTSGNVQAYSDIAVKENIVKIDSAVDKVKQINGYTYDRIDIKKQNEELGEDIPTRQAGVIAQEIEKVLPEVVSGEDGNKSVAYGNVVALLIEAIKEQQEQIEELKEIINDRNI